MSTYKASVKKEILNKKQQKLTVILNFLLNYLNLAFLKKLRK